MKDIWLVLVVLVFSSGCGDIEQAWGGDQCMKVKSSYTDLYPMSYVEDAIESWDSAIEVTIDDQCDTNTLEISPDAWGDGIAGTEIFFDLAGNKNSAEIVLRPSFSYKLDSEWCYVEGGERRLSTILKHEFGHFFGVLDQDCDCVMHHSAYCNITDVTEKDREDLQKVENL